MARWHDSIVRSLPVLGAACLGGVVLALGCLDTDLLVGIGDCLAGDGRSADYDAARWSAIQRRACQVGAVWLLVALAVGALLRRARAGGVLRGWLSVASRAAGRTARFAREEVLHAGLLLGFTAALAVSALAALDQPVRCDEAATFLNYVIKSWPFAVAAYDTNNHLLYTVLAKLAHAAVGGDSLPLRLPSLCAGVALVPACYVAFRVHFERSVGLLVAALIAASAYTIDFATNGRSYALLALLTAVLLALAPGLLTARSPRRWLAFVALAAAGFATVPVMAYPFAVLVCWLALASRDLEPAARAAFWRRLGCALPAIGVLVAAAYTPAAVVTGAGEGVANDVIRANQHHAPTALLDELAVVVRRVFRDWTHGQVPGLGWLIASGCAAGVALHRGCARLLLSMAVGLGGVSAAVRAVPPSWIFLFLLPLVAGVGFAGLLAAARRSGVARVSGVSAACAVALCTAGTFHALTRSRVDTVPWYVGYRDARVMAAYLAPRLDAYTRIEGHNVVVPPVLFYLRRAGHADPWWLVRGVGRKVAPEIYLIRSRRHESGTRRLRRELEERGYREIETVAVPELRESELVRMTRTAGSARRG